MICPWQPSTHQPNFALVFRSDQSPPNAPVCCVPRRYIVARHLGNWNPWGCHLAGHFRRVIGLLFFGKYKIEKIGHEKCSRTLHKFCVWRISWKSCCGQSASGYRDIAPSHNHDTTNCVIGISPSGKPEASSWNKNRLPTLAEIN